MGNNAKKDLYARVERMRKNLGIAANDPVNALELCTRRISAVEIVYHTFDTTGFCGAAFAGNKMNTIVLNSARSKAEWNFDCGHELIHLVKHRDINDGIFKCFKKNQNSFLEWQANEGAAELLIPYKDFIPRFVRFISHGNPFYGNCNIQARLANIYNVTEQVINNRIRNLSYEIFQYQRGTPLDSIEILSWRKQQERGIAPPAYLSMCDFAPPWDAVIG